MYFYLQGQKEAYSELAAYQAWNGNDFSNIKMITQAECNAIPLKGLVRLPQGMFVKVAGNPTVYRIEGTTARPYTTYSALLRDSQGKIIYTITIPLLHTYSLGAIIN